MEQDQKNVAKERLVISVVIKFLKHVQGLWEVSYNSWHRIRGMWLKEAWHSVNFYKRINRTCSKLIDRI